MDVSKEEKNTKSTKQKPTEQSFKGFTFGYSQRKRKPVFYNFSKDLLKTLPET